MIRIEDLTSDIMSSEEMSQVCGGFIPTPAGFGNPIELIGFIPTPAGRRSFGDPTPPWQLRGYTPEPPWAG